jgi:hypothetical protein
MNASPDLLDKVIDLAAQAQRAVGPGKPFRLAVRHVQNMLGLSDQAQASRLLHTLEHKGTLVCIQRGTKTVPGGPPGKATLWQLKGETNK